MLCEFIIFFFKQKTAYEMRISDWSSDVCSSDLLESTDSTAMAAISWTYPQDKLLALQRRNENADAATPVASGVILENLRFRYAISGDSPPWRTVRAFDDGSKVFIEFPGRIDPGEAAPPFVVGPAGEDRKSTRLNYRHQCD